MKPVLLRPTAEEDLERAYSWYEDQREGLGREFLSAVLSAMRSVRKHPVAYPVVHPGVRRVLVSRFPYGVFYRVEDDAIYVFACTRGSRDPRQWKSRI